MVDAGRGVNGSIKWIWEEYFQTGIWTGCE